MSLVWKVVYLWTWRKAFIIPLERWQQFCRVTKLYNLLSNVQRASKGNAVKQEDQGRSLSSGNRVWYLQRFLTTDLRATHGCIYIQFLWFMLTGHMLPMLGIIFPWHKGLSIIEIWPEREGLVWVAQYYQIFHKFLEWIDL